MGVFLSALVKEQEIAFLQVPSYGAGDGQERLRAVRHVQARGQIAVLHQTAAVEARGAVAFVLVGPVDHGLGDMGGLLAHGRGVLRLQRRGKGGACGENADAEKNSAIKE